MQKFDIERAYRGLEQINVQGSPDWEVRKHAIEDAIRWIGTDPENAFQENYIGVKTYAHFGDDMARYAYGYGPRHGVIEFRIEHSDAYQRMRRYEDKTPPPLDTDAIYLLECVRDFGGVRHPLSPESVDRNYNLCEVLIKRKELMADLAAVDSVINLDTPWVESYLEN